MTHVASVLSVRALRFVRIDPRLLAFGLLLNLGSAFGQTFFISLFSGEIRAAFAISNGEFGAIYSAATLASAALLSWSGRWIDRIDLRRWTAIVIVLSAFACVAMALTQDLWMLVLGIFLLRHMGQGLMTHTAITSQGRYYENARGRAVATAGLGEPLAEAIFPLVVVLTIAAIGWRQGWTAFAVGLVLVLLPVCLWLLRGHDRRHQRYLHGAADGTSVNGGSSHWTRKAVLRDPRFYFLLPVILAPAFISTGLFFHQIFLVEAKGWALESWAATYVAFAAASVVAGLAFRCPCRSRRRAGHPALAVAPARPRLPPPDDIERSACRLGLHDSRGRLDGRGQYLLRGLLASRLWHGSPGLDSLAGLRAHRARERPLAGADGRGARPRRLHRDDYARVRGLLRRRERGGAARHAPLQPLALSASGGGTGFETLGLGLAPHLAQEHGIAFQASAIFARCGPVTFSRIATAR